MDDKIKQALQTDRVIDITTTGRKSRQPRRIEIWFHNLDGKLYITGSPGKRSWYANMLANPDFVFHLKRSHQADIPARARPIQEEAERRQVLGKIIAGLDGERNLDEWMANSPLVEVTLNPTA
jgi:deazaflavin-dependent oxidoreductase (nitroreductase family)